VVATRCCPVVVADLGPTAAILCGNGADTSAAGDRDGIPPLIRIANSSYSHRDTLIKAMVLAGANVVAKRVFLTRAWFRPRCVCVLCLCAVSVLLCPCCCVRVAVSVVLCPCAVFLNRATQVPIGSHAFLMGG